MVTKHTLV